MTIETFTMFRTTDGMEHRTMHAARAHDELVSKCRTIMISFGHGPKSSNGYRQHPAYLVASARDAFLRTVQHKHTLIPQLIAKLPEVHISHFDRLFCDGVIHGEVLRTWNRLACMDDQGREFAQRYFMSHPDEAVLEP